MEFLGFEEILVILLILLLVVGPERLPEIAGKLGRAVRRFTSTVSELSRDITAEVEEPAAEIKRDLAAIGQETSSILKDTPGDLPTEAPPPPPKEFPPQSKDDRSKT